jgi:hypothetical protein
MHQKTIKRGNWFEIYDGPCFTLARRLPARFDISREISMPLMSAPRLARQIRQDIWRKLQSIRGFLPVVEITDSGAHLHIRAGGELTCPAPFERSGERIFDVLSNRDNQRRWAAFAAARGPHCHKQKALPSC